MKRALTMIVAVLLIVFTGCDANNSAKPNDPEAPTSVRDPESEPETDATLAEAMEQSRILEYFYVYSRREKPFVWKDLEKDLKADGHSVLQYDEYFLVYDTANEGIWLGGELTTDDDITGTAGSAYDDSDTLYYITLLGYYLDLDQLGGLVIFKSSGDEYYTSLSQDERTKVDTFDDIVDFLLEHTTG